MSTENTMMATRTLAAKDFSLLHTLDSGQLFRWWPEAPTRRSPGDGAGGFVLAASGRVWRLRQRDERLYVENCARGDLRFLSRFFGLDVELGPILRGIRKAGLRPEIVRRWRGLRIARQDPWECLVSFACSSATNIPRIRRMVQALSRRWGRPIAFGDRTVSAFPGPGELGDERELRRLGLGFRAVYLAKINRLVDHAWLDALKDLPCDDARRRLMQLPGVGRKIADCVLLFAYGRYGAFPVDTWIRRAMRREFFEGRRASDSDIRALAAGLFGRYAGYAQQYLYHEWRHGAGRGGAAIHNEV